MGQTRSRKYARKHKTRRGGGMLNRAARKLQPATKRIAPPLSTQGFRFLTTAAPPPPIKFMSLYTRPDAKVPKSVITSATPKQLREILEGHGGLPQPKGTRVKKLQETTLEHIKSLGLLEENIAPNLQIAAPPKQPITSMIPNTQEHSTSTYIRTFANVYDKTKSINAANNAAYATTYMPIQEQTTRKMVQVMYQDIMGSDENIFIYIKNLILGEPPSGFYLPIADPANIPSIQDIYRRRILNPLFEKFRITDTNRKLLKRGGITNKNIANFDHSVQALLDLILKHTSRKDALKMAEVFTPDRMRRLKEGLFQIFIISPNSAKKVLDTLLSDILPRSNYSPGSIDKIITTMQINPNNIEETLIAESGYIAMTQRNIINQTILADAKGMGWFKARAFYTLLLGGLGIIPLFILYWHGIYTPEGAVFAIRQVLGPYVNRIPIDEIRTEGSVFFDALTQAIMIKQQNISETVLGRNLSEVSRTITEGAATAYEEFTEPARPKPAHEQFADYIRKQYNSFFSSETTPMISASPRPPEMR